MEVDMTSFYDLGPRKKRCSESLESFTLDGIEDRSEALDDEVPFVSSFVETSRRSIACDRCRKKHKRCDRFDPCSECMLAEEGSCDQTGQSDEIVVDLVM